MWVSLEEDTDLISDLWGDASQVSGTTLDVLLRAAQEQCEEYAPALEEDDPVPARYRQAVVLQARANWEAARREAGGEGDYQITPRPMDRTIRLLLRPTSLSRVL